GSATAGEAYAGERWHLQFNGETNLTIAIPILQDTVPECDENFSLVLFNPDGSTELGGISAAFVTIHNYDSGQSAVRYVNAANLSPAAPYTNWATAAITIQDAVDAAVAGDGVSVTKGVYAPGGSGAAGGV